MEKIDRQFLENIFGTNPDIEDLENTIKTINQWIVDLLTEKNEKETRKVL